MPDAPKSVPLLPETLDEIERLRSLEEQRLGGSSCTVCGHIIDWKGHCACDAEYLGIRGGEKAEQTAIDLHEAKCEIERLRAEISANEVWFNRFLEKGSDVLAALKNAEEEIGRLRAENANLRKQIT